MLSLLEALKSSFHIPSRSAPQKKSSDHRLIVRLVPPHRSSSGLEWQDPMMKHYVDYIHQLEACIDHGFDLGLELLYLFLISPVKAFGGLGV